MPNYFTLVRTVFEAIATVIFSHVKIITGIKLLGFPGEHAKAIDRWE